VKKGGTKEQVGCTHCSNEHTGWLPLWIWAMCYLTPTATTQLAWNNSHLPSGLLTPFTADGHVESIKTVFCLRYHKLSAPKPAGCTAAHSICTHTPYHQYLTLLVLCPSASGPHPCLSPSLPACLPSVLQANAAAGEAAKKVLESARSGKPLPAAASSLTPAMQVRSGMISDCMWGCIGSTPAQCWCTQQPTLSDTCLGGTG
jgi:hypothetical protein